MSTADRDKAEKALADVGDTLYKYLEGGPAAPMEDEAERIAKKVLQEFIDNDLVQEFVHRYACQELELPVDTLIGGESVPEESGLYARYYDLTALAQQKVLGYMSVQLTYFGKP